jgi:uncharacterized protein (DUF1330 family)
MNAYTVAHIDVADHDMYAEYTARAPATVEAFGGKYLARNGRKTALEGELPDRRIVVMQFPSYEKAREWYASKEYQELIPIRQRASRSGSIVLIEGYEPPAN